MSIESDPQWAELGRLLRCLDCPSVVLRGRTRDGDMVVYVEHSPTCPTIPPECRERGEYLLRIDNPELIMIQIGEESADGQQEE